MAGAAYFINARWWNGSTPVQSAGTLSAKDGQTARLAFGFSRAAGNRSLIIQTLCTKITCRLVTTRVLATRIPNVERRIFCRVSVLRQKGRNELISKPDIQTYRSISVKILHRTIWQKKKKKKSLQVQMTNTNDHVDRNLWITRKMELLIPHRTILHKHH